MTMPQADTALHEQRDSWWTRRAPAVAGVGVAVVVLVIGLIAIVVFQQREGQKTGQSIQRDVLSIVKSIQASQVRHSQTLTHIDSLTNAIKAEQQTEATGSAKVGQLLTEAGQVVTRLEQDQVIDQNQLMTICAALAIHCPAPATG